MIIKTRTLSMLVSLLILLAVSTLSTANAQAHSGLVQVVGALTRDVRAKPGETVAQTITVQNTGSEPAYVDIYFQDMAFGQDGRARLSDETHPRSGTSWMTGPEEPILVPGGQTIAIPFQVTVPGDASGSYWAGVIVRPEGVVGQSWNINDRTNVPVRVIAQYAGVVFVDVDGSGQNSIVFEAATVAESDSGPVVELQVRNEGDRADLFTVRAQFMSDAGELVHEEAFRARLVGGHERTLVIPLGDTPPGEYTMIVTADADQPQLFARQYRVRIP